jgi:hypothetical protein
MPDSTRYSTPLGPFAIILEIRRTPAFSGRRRAIEVTGMLLLKLLATLGVAMQGMLAPCVCSAGSKDKPRQRIGVCAPATCGPVSCASPKESRGGCGVRPAVAMGAPQGRGGCCAALVKEEPRRGVNDSCPGDSGRGESGRGDSGRACVGAPAGCCGSCELAPVVATHQRHESGGAPAFDTAAHYDAIDTAPQAEPAAGGQAPLRLTSHQARRAMLCVWLN